MFFFYSILFALSIAEVPAEHAEVEAIGSVEEIIQNWQKAEKNAGPRTGTFRVYDYNQVFLTEKRGVGRFEIEAPDKWMVVFQPEPGIPEGAVHKFGDKTYKVEPRKSEIWSYDNGIYTEENSQGIRELNINEAVRDIETDWLIKLVFVQPAVAMAPFKLVLFPHLSDTLIDDFKIELGDKSKPDFHLIARPETQSLRKSVQKIEILLDRDTYRTKAFQLHRPSGDGQTTYILHYSSECTVKLNK